MTFIQAYRIAAIVKIPEIMYKPMKSKLKGVEWLPSFERAPVQNNFKIRKRKEK